jgi:tetratricopeptide (TPR) repeat protein
MGDKKNPINELESPRRCVTIGLMRRAGLTAVFLVMTWAAAQAQEPPDPLTQARVLYNAGQFEAAVEAAERARTLPALADRADLIAARAFLERYRETVALKDLTSARERLRRLDPLGFDARERAEFIVGLGETLYFDESYGAAADLLESVLEGSDNALSGDARERVLDWWAIAVDRQAWTQSYGEQQSAYQRIRDRMSDELKVRPASATAGYWVASAARSQGDLQGAWDAVEAGWLRATLATDRGAALRAALDQLMLLAIVPERARALGQSEDEMRLLWEQFKDHWQGRD